MSNPPVPPIGQQALIRDITNAARNVGVVGDPAPYNRAVDAFRRSIPDPRARESQSFGIYFRDYVTSYRGDSGAVKMLQDVYKFLEEPLVNDIYAVARDWVENKPDIPVLFGNIAMVTAQIPPPAGVILTGVAGAISVISSLLGTRRPPPPPTPEDLINRDFVLDMVGHLVRDAESRWIWTNEKRGNLQSQLAGSALGTLMGRAWAWNWLRELQDTNVYGHTSANPQRRIESGGGEFGLTAGNHTRDIDIYALESKVRNEQADRHFWWLMWAHLSLESNRGKMLNNQNQEQFYDRTLYFLSCAYYRERLRQMISSMTYYQKVVDVAAFLTGRMQAFLVLPSGQVRNLIEPNERIQFDFLSTTSPSQILNLYIAQATQLRQRVMQRRNELAGQGLNGRLFISRPLIEAAAAAYDLSRDERILILKALRYGVMDVPSQLQGVGENGQPINIEGFDEANVRGAFYHQLLYYAYMGLPCYIEESGVPVNDPSGNVRYLPNLHTYKGLTASCITQPSSFNNWSQRYRNQFKQAISRIRSEPRLFKRCLLRKAVLQYQDVMNGTYVGDFLNDISVSDLKAEFPTASDIVATINEMREDGASLDARGVIQTWYYFVGRLPEGMTEEQAEKLGVVLDSSLSNSAFRGDLLKTAAIGAIGFVAAKKAGLV